MQTRTLTLAGVMIILLIIAFVSIGMVMQPVKAHIPVYDSAGVERGEVVESQTLMDGLPDSWEKYPEYNIGLGFIAVIAFAGAILVCSIMVNEKEKGNEAIQSKSSGV